MSLTIDIWQLLSAFGAVLGVFLTVLFATGRLLIQQFEKRLDARFVVQEKAQKDAQNHMDARFSGLDQSMARGNDEWLRIERELMQLKAELPNNYVRREDYIRHQSVIESKIDGLAVKIENAILRGDRGHG